MKEQDVLIQKQDEHRKVCCLCQIFTLTFNKYKIEESCVVASVPSKETHMKYHITYRLHHPQYLPALFVTVMEASSHAELNTKVARIKTKWQARGYRVQIMHVTPQKKAKRKQHLL